MTTEDKGPLEREVTPGPRLYQVTVGPDTGAVAAVGIVHGYAEHSGRYAHVQAAWAERGIVSVAIDLRGHGRAEGPRGACRSFDEYMHDMTELERLVAKKAPGLPAFLFGHSFGGLVAASRALTRPGEWKGLMLSGPYFRLALPVPPLKLLAGKIAARIIPSLSIPSGLSGKDVTHDPDKARAYDEDPLVFPKANARWFVEATKAQERCLARAPELTMPLYLVVGTADHVASPEGGRTFYDRAGSADKTKDEKEGLFHEVLNEPEWRPIADAMAEWILSHARP